VQSPNVSTVMTSLSSAMVCTAQAMPGPGLDQKPPSGQHKLMTLEGQRHAGCGPLSPQKVWLQACSRCRIAQSADPAGQGTSTHITPTLCTAFALPDELPLCPSELFLHVTCNQQPAVLAQHCSRCRQCLCTTDRQKDAGQYASSPP